MTRECVLGRHDDGQQVRARAVAVDVDLVHQRAVVECGLELGHRDELTLRQLEHVVAAVDVLHVVGAEFGDDVAGAVEAVLVEHRGGDFGPLVVTREQLFGFDEQFAARVRPVGAEVAEFGDIVELVVDHRRPTDHAVDEHRARFGRAVALQQMHVQQLLDPRLELGRDRRGAGEGADEAAAEHVLPCVGQHLGLDGGAVPAAGQPAVDAVRVLPEQHVPDARDEVHLRRPGQGQILQEGRQVALGGEVDGAAARQGAVEDTAAHDVAHRQEAERDGGQDALLVVPVRIGPGPPHVGDLALRIDGALRRTRAARRVDQQCERVIAVGDDCGRPAPAAAECVGQCLDDDGATRLREPGLGRLERLPLVVDLGTESNTTRRSGAGPVRISSTASSTKSMLDAISVGSVSATMGCSWATGRWSAAER